MIYILTHNRTTQTTYANLPDELRKDVVFVVHPDTKLAEGLTRLDCPVQGIGAYAVRDFIMQQAKEDIVIMLDDDIMFKENIGGKFITATHSGIIDGFAKMTEKAGEYDCLFTSLGTTFFNDGSKEWNENGRNSHSFFINRAAAERVGATFIGVPTCEDTYFTLLGLTRGLKNYIYLDLCATSPANLKGGEALSGDRAERHEAAVKVLKEKFPEFVTVRQNKNKEHMRNIGTPMDISVRWKKAYSHRPSSRGLV